MLKALKFGEWTPDLAETGTLTEAVNVRAIANGYAPVRGFKSVTPTLGGAFVGGGAFVQGDGTAHFLAARADALLRYSGGSWVSALGGQTTSRRWYLAQFGDNVVAANGQQLLNYVMASATAAVIADAPGNAKDVATVRDFVMCLTSDNQVVWSGFNNLTQWTSGENQSDYQPLLDGGEGVRIIGGEYGIILQKNCIRRVSYVGTDIVFQFDKVSPEIGCMAEGSVAVVGRLVFFLSERGFEMFDGSTVTPIGDEKFSRWFFSQYSREDIAGMWSTVDPRGPWVYWSMPGTPGKTICYNWVLQRATVIEMDVAGMFTGVTSNVSIDALDATYGDLDSIPVSLDDPSFRGGNPMLLVVDASNALGTLADDNLEARLRLSNVEPAPGKRARIRAVRPITDATSASLVIDARMRAGDAESVVSAGSMRLNGKLPIRSNGRYNDMALTIPAGEAWSYAQGLEIEFEAGDGR